MATNEYKIKNPTKESLIVFDVGLFKPGTTTVELTKEQVQIVKDNAILEVSKVDNAPAEPQQEEPQADQPQAQPEEEPSQVEEAPATEASSNDAEENQTQK